MEWKEIERGQKWQSGNLTIKKGLRFRNAALVPERIKSFGQYIYHCYKKNQIQDDYVGQSMTLEEAKKLLESFKK